MTPPKTAFESLDLCGTWMLRYSDGQRGRLKHARAESTDPSRYLSAQVPGELHLDLMRQGLIQDPNFGLNALAARWVEEALWAYRREFEAPPLAPGSRAWLVFEQLDLAALVVLNGRELARHQNAFLPLRVEVTDALKPGRNVLAVELEAGLWAAADKPGVPYGQMDSRLHKRHWLRKPQYQFGWDWATRLLNVGMGKVRLEWSRSPARVDGATALASLDAGLQNGGVTARFFVEGLDESGPELELSLRLPELGLEAKASFPHAKGARTLSLELAVPAPEPWWPVGLGAPRLYEARLEARQGGGALWSGVQELGFRHVALDQSPRRDGGSRFHFRVNGKPVFAKGGNLVPADLIQARIEDARSEGLVARALECNFNFLRVWGGGFYESDAFYRACDRAGMLVWQEFIYACSKYPTTDEAFYLNAKEEARWQARRLAGHASLVAWCGNNELEQGCWDWDWDQGEVLPDHAFFHVILPRILKEEDPQRWYQPSSPFSPGFVSPNDDKVGDQHPWTVGFGDNDFRKYREMPCSFPNEGGILGPPSLPTLRAALPAGQGRPGGFAWLQHDNSVDGWFEPSAPDQMLKDWLGLEAASLSLEDYCYWAGVLQGEGLKEYCESFRMRWPDSGGAVFWMFNDCWPTVRSWAVIDYFQRRCPSFHPVRRAFAPVHVALRVLGDAVEIWGLNATDAELRARLDFGFLRFAGGGPAPSSLDVRLEPLASTLLARLPKGEWKDPAAQAPFAELSAGGRLLARNRLFLPLFRELKLAPSRLRFRLEGGKAVFESDVFEWNVCVDLDGEQPLGDNFFDVYPGRPYVIDWPAGRELKILKSGNPISS